MLIVRYMQSELIFKYFQLYCRYFFMLYLSIIQFRLLHNICTKRQTYLDSMSLSAKPSEEITQSSFLFLFLAKSRNRSLIVTRHRASRPLGRLNTTSALNTFLGTPSWRAERHETTEIKTGTGLRTTTLEQSSEYQ